MRWSGLLVLLVGVMGLLGTQNVVLGQSAPNVGSYKLVSAKVLGPVKLVFDRVQFPRMLSVFFDRQIYDYKMIGPMKVRLTYSSGKTRDLVQKYRSADKCTNGCALEVEIVRDQVTEHSGTVRLLFRVTRATNLRSQVHVGFRITNSNSALLGREWRVKTMAMLENAVKYFEPAGCTNSPTTSGLCNNRLNLASGGVNQVLRRMENQRGVNRINNPSYEDSMAAPRRNRMPNARDISNGVNRIPTNRRGFKLTDAFVTFGQFLDHDIILTPGGGSGLFADNSMEIWVNDPNDNNFNDGVIMFTRSSFDRRDLGNDRYQEVVPRQHLNVQTSFVDASQVYGATPERMYLRTFKNGMMMTNSTSTGIHCPNNIPEIVGLKQEMDPNPNDTRFLAAGDARANENALLLSFHTLFLREHNRVAKILKATTCPSCNDEKLFSLARRVVMTEMQIITFEEWLPLLIGYKIDYYGYDDYWDAGIMQEFSTAAMRFGHSMQSEEHLLKGPGRTPKRRKINLRDSFFNPELVKEHGIESFLRGAAEQIAQPFDHQISDSLRNFLFRKVPHAIGVDLFAANIQRGRDHGLPSYNQARVMCDLEEKDFDQMGAQYTGMSEVLRKLYQSPADVDLFVGGILDPQIYNGEVGETFACILHIQFNAIMHGDRFFYKSSTGFPKEITQCDQLVPISQGKFSFRELVLANTDIKPFEIPQNLFKR